MAHSISRRRPGVALCTLGRQGEPFVHFSLVEFSGEGVSCDGCVERIARRQEIHARVTAPSTRPTLLDQIKDGMRRRYGPSIEDPDWATEGFVPR